MLRPLQLIRLIKINITLVRYAFTRSLIGKEKFLLYSLTYLNPWSFSSQAKSRGEAIRIALEKLGPIFVKFGQMLSTRRDLLPNDLADELAKLQDQVPSFPGETAKALIEQAFGRTTEECFAQFDIMPLASASIAQVHTATLKTGEDVIIKVLRPKIEKTIRQDLALMFLGAKLARLLWKHGKRLHPVELVKEFEDTIINELDLTREAANASQLRRNFAGSSMMYVPKIYWDFVHHNVLVMERIYGTRISDVSTLKAAGTDMKKLAEYGVEIFFTQVLRDSFFHADMHPGNLFVDTSDPKNPKYLGVDFGIMGTLSPDDQQYLAENLLAFFKRDYRKVAELHIESGWIPADTRVDKFESAIRTVSEPIFEKPLRDISFGQLLLRLFRTAEQFNMEIQPQLMLLQKTLLSIEGLGRQLYPDLDLWNTAKPFLEKWMRQQRGVCKTLKESITDIGPAVDKLIKTPQLLYNVLHEVNRLQHIQRHQTPGSANSSKSKGAFLFGCLGLLAGAAITYAAICFTG